ncbi:MAG: polysaccharide pyruvyl transferase family protein [Spirochaetales bacterium]|nr:polysaccharide pyruvyl transferase family protein [Spirochaetales bacterium]
MTPLTSKAGRSPRILLVGYNGANNTGAEARLLTIIKDVQDICGAGAQIIIPTLNKKNLLRFVKETEQIKIVSIPAVFFMATKKLVKQCDLVILIEGSCYMDSWTNALLWVFLYATHTAFKFKKPCLAYAVDTGSLSQANSKRVKRCASKTDLIITRSYHAQNRLKEIGVTAPITTTADNAFYFPMNSAHNECLKQLWPAAHTPTAGMALVDFYKWPVVIKPWGTKQNCYKWPYYFSASKERQQKSSLLARSYAQEADRIIRKHNYNIALICMESLDRPFARQVFSLIRNKERVRIFSSSEYNVSELTGILRGLDLLISSRYHACVLSMQAAVPLIGIGHDFRIQDLFKEMGIYNSYFIRYDNKNIVNLLRKKIDTLLKNAGQQKRIIRRAYCNLTLRALKNPLLLKDFIALHGWLTTA